MITIDFMIALKESLPADMDVFITVQKPKSHILFPDNKYQWLLVTHRDGLYHADYLDDPASMTDEDIQLIARSVMKCFERASPYPSARPLCGTNSHD